MAGIQNETDLSPAEIPHTPTLAEQQASSEPAYPKPYRSSSIRFSENTNISSRSSMPSRQQTDTSDEITPIRAAETHADRTYNTTDVTSEADQSTARKPSTSTVGGNQSQQSPKKPRWYKRVAEKYGSVSLQNKGSVARDHLALERTFLAWLRTSLAFASIGIAVTQLFRLNVSLQGKKRSLVSPADGYSASQLPYSPLMGYGLPPELIPLLQQLTTSDVRPWSLPVLGPTLLDQLLNLGPEQIPLGATAFDDPAAAKLRHVGKPLGATFIGISIIVLCVGFHRYFEAQYWIMRGKFPASRGGIALIGLIAAALIIASFVVVLVIAPGQYEKR